MTGAAAHTVDGTREGLARFAPVPVLSAMVALAVVLGITAGAYGYHRDELYFRMLAPAWGYADQPPLTPALARLFSGLVADEVWAVRIPAIVFAVGSVLVVALITREMGGTGFAQGLAAWGYGFGAFTLTFGHVLLTASVDLLVWPAVLLAVVRAVRRSQPWWWLVAGIVVGLSLYNKLLIAMLLVALAVGLAAVGPRSVFRSGWLYAGIGALLLIGAPNLVYQAVNGWPQLAMGEALSSSNGGEVRVLMWPFLLLLLGPPLVPFWVAGIVGLLRRPEWRPVRFIAVAFGVLLVLVAVAGAQFYYPYGMLVVLYAIGCVPVARWANRGRGGLGRRVLVVAAVALNAVVSMLISLPVIPVGVLGLTPVPSMNQVAADQIGWPQYVAQIEGVAASASGDAGTTIVLASNYGEAGALERYGTAALPPVYSGHNALGDLGPPAPDVSTVVIVGGQFEHLRSEFEQCDVAASLSNGFGVDNEEEGEPVAVCQGPLEDWTTLWGRIRHLD